MVAEGESGGSGVEYATSRPDPEPDRPVHEMRKKDALVRIGKKIGVHMGPHSCLTIEALNSMWAYITGGYFVEPRLVGTPDSPGPAEIRVRLAYKVGFEQFPRPEHSERTFRLGELRALVLYLNKHDDQRDWTP